MPDLRRAATGILPGGLPGPSRRITLEFPDGEDPRDSVPGTGQLEDPDMDIQESVQKILGRQEVVADLFYAVYLDRHPEIRTYFVGIDLKRQAVLLSMSLLLVAHHYLHRYPATVSYLKILGHRHQTRRGVPAWAFPSFAACLLETLAQFLGDEWDQQLESQWREAIDLASETMLSGYDQPLSV
jgi:hemoglobin-like flavoprotein